MLTGQAAKLPAIGSILTDTVDGARFRVESIEEAGPHRQPRIFTTGVESWQGPHTVYLDELRDYAW